VEHINKIQKRVIPVLTLDNDKLVKTIKFKKPNYIGDPINAVKIFNDKEVDEIVLLDITATIQKREPNYSKIEDICSEAFMPFAYGGGIANIEQVDRLFSLGIEKVVLNSVTASNLSLIQQILEKYGSQSIVGSIDVGENLFGKKHVYTHSGTKKSKKTIEEYINDLINLGIGEIFLNSINRDGTFQGYDLDLVSRVSQISSVPIVVCGGACDLENLKAAIDHGASAVAAGSLFIYRREARGILINYPSQEILRKIFIDIDRK
jgi:cyclase